MAEAATSNPATAASEASPLLQSSDLFYGIVLLAQFPSLLGYIRRVWSSGHYQFAVLFVPVVVFLMYQRLEKLGSTNQGSRPIVMLLWLVSAVLMVLSTFVAPHFWILAFMALSAAYVYDRFGTDGVTAVLPLWLLLLIVVPLPRGLDNLLVTKMQILASKFGSSILDSMGFVHFLNGVILVTPTDQFMTEEACSGIRSLFSSLGAIGLYCVINRYPWWRTLFNLLQTLFWVIVGNAIRIAAVVWIADNWTTEIAHGLPHEMFGLAIFLLIILLVISVDRILQVLLTMSARPVIDEASADPLIVQGTAKVSGTNQRRRLASPGLVALAVFAVLLCFCDLRLMAAGGEGHIRNPLFKLPPFPMSYELDLPAEIGNWKLEKYEPINRGEDVILAAQSYTWEYRNGNVDVTVSVDGPWEFWHDITACYRGTGWTTATTHKFDLQQNGEAESGPLNHSRIELSKVSGENALVFFAQHDMNGQEVRPAMLGGMVSLELIKLNFLQSLRSVLGIEKFDAGYRQYELPLATIQVFCDDVNGLSDSQLAELEKFYFTVRRKLIESKRFDGGE